MSFCLIHELWMVYRLIAVVQKMSSPPHAQWPGQNLSCQSPAARGISKLPAASAEPLITPPPLSTAASVPPKRTAAEPTRAAEQGRHNPTTKTSNQTRRSGSSTLTFTKTAITRNRLPFLTPISPPCKLPPKCVTDSFLVFIINVIHIRYTILPCVLWDHCFIIFQCWTIKFKRNKFKRPWRISLQGLIKEVLCDLLGEQRKKWAFLLPISIFR